MSMADRRVAEWLFLLTFAAYAYFYAGGGWNQNAAFDTTRAMVERHTFAIDAYATNTGDVSYANGHVYANKAPALSWLAAIPYFFARSLPLTIAAYLCTLVCVALPGALIPPMLYAYGRRRGVDARWCAAVACTIAFATLLFPYATIFMVAVPSGALMLYAYTSERPARAGLAAGLAAAMNYLSIASLIFARRARYAVAACLPLAALAAYQWICFGSPFTTTVAKTDPRFLTHGSVFVAPSLDALYGITFSPYRGLFFFAPVLLIATVMIRDLRIAAVAAFFLAVNVCFNGWEAGFATGARYLVPLIPLLGVGLLRCRGWMRGAVAALAAVSFAINFAAAAVDPQPSGTIPRPLTQYIVPLLLFGHFPPDVPITPPWSAATLTGHTSVNRLTHDEAILFQRHAPGSQETEWASFNLGELLFGAGDARSLIPIALLLAAGGAAIAWRVRQVPRS